MKSVNLINNLNEANIIDFNDAKKQQMNKAFDNLIEARGASIINELNSIISNAQEAINKLNSKGIYNRDYVDDLISIGSELRTLYRDMFKEE